MPRVKVKVLRGNGLEQVVTVDTEATKGATLGTDVRLPSGAVATPATFLQWLGTTPGSSSGSGSSSGPSLSSILTTKGDLATRDTQVQRLGIGTQDQALRVSAAGMPEWRSGAALTKTDDTNVTLTLGGSPATSLLAAASLTLGWTGQLGETRGGTAQSNYLQGDMLYASALNTLGKLGIGASGRWLGSSGSAPQWNAPAALTKTDDTNVTLSLGGSPTTALLNAASLTLGWTGQLGETRGGTAQSGYLTGDILYASALNTLSKLGIGSSGNVLTVAGGVPTWAAPTSGATGANPTASVGLAAVNGVATTYLRSDGAPALDQGIAPTWTGSHRFLSLVGWGNTGAPSNAKNWIAYVGTGGGDWNLVTANDASPLSGVKAALNFSRSGTALTSVSYGNSTDNPTHTFYGTTSFNYVGGARTANFVGTTNNYMYVGFQRNSTDFGYIGSGDATGASTSTDFGIQAVGGLSFAVNNSTTAVGIKSDGRLYGKFLHNVGTVTGTTDQFIASGTYTPTLTNVANASGSTANAAQWMRVGNVVTVSGSINATPTAGSWQLGISLPIASNITDQTQLAGAMSNGNAFARIQGDAGNDRATTFAAAGASDTYTYTFTYLIN